MKYLKEMVKDGWGVTVYPKWRGFQVIAHKAGVGDVWSEHYSLRGALKATHGKTQSFSGA